MAKRFDYVFKDGRYRMRDNGKILTHDEILNLLNEFNDEKIEFRGMVFETIDEHIQHFEMICKDQEGIILGNAPKERLTALKDFKRDLLNKMLASVACEPPLPIGRCRCVIEPVNIDCTENSEEKAKRLKEALEGIK